MRKRMPALLLILSFILVAFSGCMELERGIRVKSNGDVECYTRVYMTEKDMKYIYDTPEKFYEALQDSIDDDYPADSFEKIEKKEGSKTLLGAQATYEIDKDEVEEELNRIFKDYDLEYETSGFLVKKVTVTIKTDGKSLTSWLSGFIKDPEKQVTGMLNQTTDNVFAIQVPYPIVSTNGSKTSEEKNTAVWDLKNFDSMAGGKITMEVSYLNLPVFITIVGIAVLIIIILIVLLVLRKKKKAKTTAIAQGFEATVPAPQTMPQEAPSVQETAAVPKPQPEVPQASPAVPEPPQVPVQEMGDVPQVTGLPSVGQLPKSEMLSSDSIPTWEKGKKETYIEQEGETWKEQEKER